MAESERETKQYSLEERRYIGDDGKVHHHTNKWMAEHEGESKGGESQSARGKGSERAESKGSESKTGESQSARGKSSGSAEGKASRSGKDKESGGARGSSEENEERGGLAKGLMAAAALGVAGAAAAAVVAARTSGERVDTVEIRESGGRSPEESETRRTGTEGGSSVH